VQYRVVVEIDGVGHLAPGSVIDDALRQNDVTLGDSRVLRIPVLGLRLEPQAFLGQVRQLLINAGWNGGGTG
jgi:hypothetical protein